MRAFLSIVALASMVIFPLRTPANDDLLARMTAVNPNLHSYTATLKAHVQLTSFPFLATDLVGTYYHKEPGRDKLDITSGLPGVAKQFSRLYPHIPSPAQWNAVFVVSKVSDDGTTTTFKLVPRKRGNIDHIDAKVDNKTATITSMRWNYYNGGSATMDNQYAAVGGNMVVVAQRGNVDEPGYKGDITSTLSDYKINPPLPDSVFSEQ